MADPSIAFGPFLLDCERGRLLHGEMAVPLRRKAWAVLVHLAQSSGRLVTSDELFDVAWGGAAVTPQALTNVIAEIRTALDDDAREPRFVETIYGRGYRFLGSPETPKATGQPPETLVAREREIDVLTGEWERALLGELRVVFVAGEPGIGKSVLAEAALSTGRLAHAPQMIGHCVETASEREPHMPMLTALADFAASSRAGTVVSKLRDRAPTWLVQIPWLCEADERSRLELSLQGVATGRMVREGAELLRALAGESGMVLLLEDLHWADLATIDFLARAAVTASRSKLLILATYRPVDADRGGLPVAKLAGDLERDGVARTLHLEPFSRDHVCEYLEGRFGSDLAGSIAGHIERHTAGNPLFVRSMVDKLLSLGAIRRREDAWSFHGDAASLRDQLPADLRGFVTQELDHLEPPARHVLRLASLLGNEFDSRELQAALGDSSGSLEDTLDELAGAGRLLRSAGESEWADGLSARRYRFVHSVYRMLTEETVGPLKKRALHTRIADGLERLHAAAPGAVAARLARHFRLAGRAAPALDYLDQASVAAERRFAYQEAAERLRAALDLIEEALPPGERAARAADLWLRLGSLSVLENGYSHPVVARLFTRARAAAEAAASRQQEFEAEMGLAVYSLTIGRPRQALAHCDRLTHLSDRSFPSFRPIAACWSAFAQAAVGEISTARRTLEGAMGIDPAPGLPRYFDVGRMIESLYSLILANQGEEELAHRRASAALARSRSFGSPADLAHAAVMTTEVYVLLGDACGASRAADLGLHVSTENGFPSYRILSEFYLSYLDSGAGEDRRLERMTRALDQRRVLGDRWQESFLLALLAQRALRAQRPAEARVFLDEADAFAAEHGEAHHSPELARLRAECALVDGDRTGARNLLRAAVDKAKAGGMRLFEQRAVTRLNEIARGQERGPNGLE